MQSFHPHIIPGTCATLCSGGGLADVGLKQAGLRPIWAVEYDPAIAAVYQRNHGLHVLIRSIVAVDWRWLARPWLLWASPPCPNFSVAKTGRGETELDLLLADAVASAIRILRPAAFVLENVRGYAVSESYRRIRAALDEGDYWSDARVVNAADLGVPQTRERLILRARNGGWMQPDRPWPRPRRWRGWYEAIADLVPTLPASKFADWQLKRLPAELRESVLTMGAMDAPASKADRGVALAVTAEPAAAVTASATKRNPVAYIVSAQSVDGGAPAAREGAEPAVTAGTNAGRMRALLAPGANDWTPQSPSKPSVTVTPGSYRTRALLMHPTEMRSEAEREASEPAFTVTTGASNRGGFNPRAAAEGRVVAMTPRCLARFQGLPDDYWLPERRALACKVIGNGVPPEVARVAAETLM